MVNSYSFTIIIDNQDYTPLTQGLTNVEIYSSIYTLYPYAIMRIALSDQQIEEGILTIGKNWRLGVSHVITSETKFYDLAVWKYETTTKNIFNNTLNKDYIVYFIHPFFFKQKLYSFAYYGSTDIVAHSALLKNNLIDFFDDIFITKSYNSESRYFQLQETFGSFLEKRLMGNYLGDGPTYCFVDWNNKFSITTYNDCLKASSACLASNEIKPVYATQSDIQTHRDNHKFLSIFDIKFSFNSSGTLWHRLKAGTTYIQPFNTVVDKRTLNRKNVSTVEDPSNYYPVFYDEKEINKKEFLFTYIDDSLRDMPSILATFYDKHKYTIEDQKLIICSMPGLASQIGNPIIIDVPKNFFYSVPEASDFTTKYIISEIKLFYTKTQLLQYTSCIKDGLPTASFGNTFK
ncbi:MAG TPA: hypothetical protein PLI42_00580 [Candidatus Pacearchaeota archaeon]|nr:hypothetical protein [Candidatus Pacearchaeota archaeon]